MEGGLLERGAAAAEGGRAGGVEAGALPDVLLLPRDEAERLLGEGGYRVVAAGDVGGVEGGEWRVVRVRPAGPGAVALVLACCRPTL